MDLYLKKIQTQKFKCLLVKITIYQNAGTEANMEKNREQNCYGLPCITSCASVLLAHSSFKP
jgi:hypothetical protein